MSSKKVPTAKPYNLSSQHDAQNNMIFSQTYKEKTQNFFEVKTIIMFGVEKKLTSVLLKGRLIQYVCLKAHPQPTLSLQKNKVMTEFASAVRHKIVFRNDMSSLHYSV